MTQPDLTRKVVRDETRNVRTVTSIGPVDGDPLMTYGTFISARTRGGLRDVTADRKRYGRCVICRRAFADDDQVHMVFTVQRNGKTIGNRLCCSGCAETHATYRHREVKRD